MYKNQFIGQNGEDIAVNYLENLGYEIIERNFSCKQGEIDIIARYKNEIVFIEVKARTNSLYGMPADAVNEKKQNHLTRAIKYYIYRNHLENEFIRIDVIEVYLSGDNFKINHIKQFISWFALHNI